MYDKIHYKLKKKKKTAKKKNQLFCNVYEKKNLLQKENNYKSICKIHA